MISYRKYYRKRIYVVYSILLSRVYGIGLVKENKTTVTLDSRFIMTCDILELQNGQQVHHNRVISGELGQQGPD